MKAVVVYNENSGSALPLHELKLRFEAADIEIVDTFPVTRNIRNRLTPYTKSDVIIAAYGGDGTISRVAGALANSNTLFAPLPGGTLNHFTKDLGIPQDLDQALRELKKSKPRKIDVATVNGRIIVNNSSIGLYPSTLQMRDEMSRKPIGKWSAAIIASAKAFWRYRSYSVAIDGEAFRTPFVFVGNNDYKLEHRLIGIRENMNEGILSVYAVATTGRLALLKIFIRALFRKLTSTDEVKIWKTKSLTIRTKRDRIRISRDGEHEWVTTPLEYSILPGALRILGGKQK